MILLKQSSNQNCYFNNFESLFYLNVDAIFAISLDGNVLKVNYSAQNWSGYSEEELLNTNFFQYVNEEEQNNVRRCIESALNKGFVLCRFTFQTKDGKRKYCNAKFIPIDESDCQKGLFIVLHDISDLSEKYHESEKNFKIIAENVQDVVILLNDKLEYLYVSPSSKDVYGFSPDSINDEVPEPFFNIHPDYVKALEEAFYKATVDGKPFQLLLKALHVERGWIWTELKGTPVFDQHQQFRHMVFIARDMSKQKEYEEKLKYYAYHDALTGLPNRRYIRKCISKAMNQLNEEDKKFSIVLLDIDNFKNINDSYGHEVGDKVIVEFANRIQKAFEDVGTVARLGGDEFIALLHDVQSEEDLRATIGKAKQALCKEIDLYVNTTISITISIGVSICKTKYKKASDYIKNADQALYRVKEKGKNQFHINYL